MITEFRHIVSAIKTMETNVEQLIDNFIKLKQENEELKKKLKEYDECKTNSEESTQEISNSES